MPQTFIFPLDPVAASRVRVGRFTSYYKGPYATFRKEAGKVIDKVLKKLKPTDRALEAWFSIIVGRPTKTKLLYPMPDWDNYGKAISDELNEKIWDDDRQIVDAHVTKRWVGDKTAFGETYDIPCIAVTYREIGPFCVNKEKTVSKLPKKRKGSARK